MMRIQLLVLTALLLFALGAVWTFSSGRPASPTTYAGAGRTLLQFSNSSTSNNGTQPPPPPATNTTTNGTAGNGALPAVFTPNFDVVVIGASQFPSALSDLASKLNATGLFRNVSTFDAAADTPTAEFLAQFDGALVFSDMCFADPVQLGTLLAEYVSNAGGLLLSGAAWAQPTTQDSSTVSACSTLQGEWLTRPTGAGIEPRPDLQGFSPVLSDGRIVVGAEPAAVATRGAHRIYSALNNIRFGDAIHLATTPFDCCITCTAVCVPCADDNATLAQWNDGARLLAEATPGLQRNTSGRVVILNMHPASDDARTGGWPANSDTGRLIGNALLYAAEYQAHCRRNGALFLTDSALALDEDLHSKILEFRLGFNCTAVLAVNGSVPALNVLLGYATVVVAARQPPAGLQSVLQQYLARGGGVVLLADSLAALPNISALQVAPNASTVTLPVGAQLLFRVQQANSSLIAGVSNFTDAPGRVYPTLRLASNATLVASLAAGAVQIPLVAFLPQAVVPQPVVGVRPGAVVTLNFYAASRDAYLVLPGCPPDAAIAQARVSTEEGSRLVLNAMLTVRRTPQPL